MLQRECFTRGIALPEAGACRAFCDDAVRSRPMAPADQDARLVLHLLVHLVHHRLPSSFAVGPHAGIAARPRAQRTTRAGDPRICRGPCPSQMNVAVLKTRGAHAICNAEQLIAALRVFIRIIRSQGLFQRGVGTGWANDTDMTGPAKRAFKSNDFVRNRSCTDDVETGRNKVTRTRQNEPIAPAQREAYAFAGLSGEEASWISSGSS